MLWMVDIQGFRHIAVPIAFFIYCFFLSVLRSFFLITLFLQPCHGGDSHLSLNSPSSIPGQIIIH